MRSLGSESIGAFELGNNSWRARAQTERRQRLLSKPSGLPLWPLLAEIQDLGWQNSNAVSLRFTGQSAYIQGDGSWESNYPHRLSEKGVLPFSSQWDCSYPKSEKMRKCFRNIFFWLGYQEWAWCFHTLFLFAPSKPSPNLSPSLASLLPKWFPIRFHFILLS